MKQIADFLDFLLFEKGEAVHIDLVPATALLSDAPQSGYYTDDKFLRTKGALHSGALVTHRDADWLVTSQVQNHGNHYEGRMRKTNHVTKLIIEDWLYAFPSILEMVNLTIDSDKSLNIATGNLKATLPANEVTRNVAVNDRFIASLAAWKVVGVDLTETGLVILTAARDVFVAGDDQENEIANADTLPVWSIILDPAQLSLQPEATSTLTATLMRDTTARATAEFLWHSAAPEVATVSDGVVTGIAEGETTITALWAKHPTIQAAATVTVVDTPPVVVTYVFYTVYASGSDKSYTNFDILESDTRIFGVEKRINGVTAEVNDTYVFTFDPNGATSTNYAYTVLNSYSVQIQNKHRYPSKQVTLTAVSNESGVSSSVSFTLKAMF